MVVTGSLHSSQHSLSWQDPIGILVSSRQRHTQPSSPAVSGILHAVLTANTPFLQVALAATIAISIYFVCGYQRSLGTSCMLAFTDTALVMPTVHQLMDVVCDRTQVCDTISSAALQMGQAD